MTFPQVSSGTTASDVSPGTGHGRLLTAAP